MKSNVSFFRNCIFVLILSASFSTAFSQTNSQGDQAISNLKATIVNNNIVINWNVTDALVANYCEVQASKDGKNFTTIGLVLGADPSQTNNSFAFKQNLKKMKAGHIYYRVLSVGANYNAASSNIVKTSI